MRIMPIFFGGYHLQPTLGSGTENRPRRRLDMAPRRPPSDPHAPPALRRHRPCHPVKPGRCGSGHAASIRPVLVALSSRGFQGVQTSVLTNDNPYYRESNPARRACAVGGEARRDSVATARESLHFPVLTPCGQRPAAPPSRPRSGARNERQTSPLRKPLTPHQ